MAGARVCLCSSSFSLGFLHFKPSLSAATAFLNRPIKRYSSERHDNVKNERAPSTAQEFIRVAEEKLRHDAEEEEEGLPVSQTVKKVSKGAESSETMFNEDDNKHKSEDEV